METKAKGGSRSRRLLRSENYFKIEVVETYFDNFAAIT